MGSKPTHGFSSSRIYRVWRGLKGRCNNPTNTSFKWYGAKGISYDPRWESFEAFLQDMGLPPSDQHSIERIDRFKNYSKENCRWATPQEQQNNTSKSIFFEFNGSMKTIAQISRETGLDRMALRWRIQIKGLSANEAIADLTAKKGA